MKLLFILFICIIINFVTINSIQIKNSNNIFINNKQDTTPIKIWPLPYQVTSGTDTYLFSQLFNITTNLTTSSTLNKGIDRYYNLIFKETNNYNGDSTTTIKELSILIISDDETLQLGFDESYTLTIDSDGNCQLIGGTVYGALRGLETFYQLISYDYIRQQYSIQGSPWNIFDKPRFPHRGVMLDTSRHWYSVTVLLEFIDALAYNKFNTFHWHAVDSQSFPLTSTTFPNVTQGAWSSQEIYSTKDIKLIIQHAKERGIRVELELDMPGHAWSWGTGYPNVLPMDFDKSSQCNLACPTQCNVPLDPSSDESYAMAFGLLEEFGDNSMFSEQLLHIGGDEVVYACWNSSEKITSWMKTMGMSSFQDAAQYFELQAIDKLLQLGKSPVMWEDAFLLSQDKLPKDVIIQIYHNPLLSLNTTGAGFKTLQSPYNPYYLDNPSVNWKQVYSFEPSTGIPESDINLLLGGETCMWSELVDDSDLFSRVYPRASATSERLWSPITTTDLVSAEIRLETFRCSLLFRSIGSAPLNSTSPLNPNSCYLS